VARTVEAARRDDVTAPDGFKRDALVEEVMLHVDNQECGPAYDQIHLRTSPSGQILRPGRLSPQASSSRGKNALHGRERGHERL
jgi:hypothetical protein